MDIKTKFNIGDTVHFMWENKGMDLPVDSINIVIRPKAGLLFDGKIEPRISYFVTIAGDPECIEEDDCYATKDQLRASI